MAYAEQSYYETQYLGNLIPAEDFPRLAQRASDYLDYITMGRAQKAGELPALQKACCALAEQYLAVERSTARSAAQEGEVASETVGPWSRTYRSAGETSREIEAQLRQTAALYLAGTGLMSRAMGRGCHGCGCPTP